MLNVKNTSQNDLLMYLIVWLLNDNCYSVPRLINMTQEIGFVDTVQGELDYAKYPIGSMLFILPWHVSCMLHLRGYYSGSGIVTLSLYCFFVKLRKQDVTYQLII